jgi:pectate lyase
MPAKPLNVLGISLGLSLTFWALAVLYLLKISRLFHGIMKLLGPLTYVVMLAGPLVAVVLGVRRLRSGQGTRLAWCAVVGGGLMVVAFIGVIAVPLAMKASARAAIAAGGPRALPPDAGRPVFPGAEGFGTRTAAGRGGKVLFVTSLADSGPGTLRDAVNQPFPRTIIFRVGGTIELESELQIQQPFVTVAGQTAPGDGILLKNAGMTIFTHDVLVQHLRVRPGDRGKGNPENNDALGILNTGSGRDEVYNVVVDHCSFSWSEDETVSTWYAPRDITLSWCIISEALNRARHPKKTHSAGLLIGDGSDRVTVHHCLLAHHDFRNPLITGGGTHDFINNVVYDWGKIPVEIQDRHGFSTFVNFIGNRYVRGPSTESPGREIALDPRTSPDSPKLFVADNLTPHRASATADEWDIVGAGYSGKPAARTHQASAPFSTAPVRRTPAADIVEPVLLAVGATRPIRDAVDARIVSEVRTGEGRIINSPEDVGGYPRMQNGEAPKDSDSDGIPDEWEKAHGLNPQDPSDASRPRTGTGYTNLEEYLHSLGGQNRPEPTK